MRPATAGRALGAAEIVVGAALVARPSLVLDDIGAHDDDVVRVAARILGARMVGQGAALLLVPTVRVATLSAVADVVHAMSMTALAVVDARRRRSALVSATVAAASGGGCWSVAVRLR